MSEEKAGRGASFSMLFLAELVAQAAIGFVAVRFVMGADWDGSLGEIGAEEVGTNLISPFLRTFWLLQGMSVLLEKARGNGCPWGSGRWVAVYWVFVTPMDFAVLFMYNEIEYKTISLMSGSYFWLRWLDDCLSFCVYDHTAPLIAILVSLRLGRSREERARAVVDAREWVGRGLAAVLIACFVGMGLLGFIGY